MIINRKGTQGRGYSGVVQLKRMAEDFTRYAKKKKAETQVALKIQQEKTQIPRWQLPIEEPARMSAGKIS